MFVLCISCAKFMNFEHPMYIILYVIVIVFLIMFWTIIELSLHHNRIFKKQSTEGLHLGTCNRFTYVTWNCSC